MKMYVITYGVVTVLKSLVTVMKTIGGHHGCDYVMYGVLAGNYHSSHPSVCSCQCCM